MKKLLTILISLLMVLAIIPVGIAGPPPPAPVKIVVSVNGVGINYDDTKVTNKFTGEVLTKDDVNSLVIINGVGFFDLSKFKQGYETAGRTYAGDEIEIVACNVDPACTQTFYLESTDPRTIQINVNTENLYVCWDNSVVTSPSLCPEEEEEEPEPEESVVETVTKVTSGDNVALVEADYGQDIEVIISNNKLSGLIDEEITFDDEEYDVKEQVYVTTITQTSIDDEDFGLNPYLIFYEGDFEYRYIIEDIIDLELISEDEPLEITFLGEKLKIIEASETQVTIRFGTEFGLKEGESKFVEGKKVTVIAVTEDLVSIEVDGISESVTEGDSREINGLDVLVDEIVYQAYADGIHYATLIVGNKVEETYNHGDDFELFIEDDEEWKWVINFGTEQYIGVVNQEDYKSVDEDEDYMPITVGEYLALPNNYVVIEFKEVSTSDTVGMEFKVKDEYLFVKGDTEEAFVFGTEEYEKLYIKSDGFYDSDKEFITSEDMRIGDSETYLELGSLKIGKITILLDMSDILYDAVSYLAKDSKYMDYLGIIFEDPENAVDDQAGFKVSVPEERPELTISFGMGVPEEEEEEVIDDDVVVIPPDDDIIVTPPVDDDVDVVVPPVVPPVVEPPVVEPPVEPDFSLKALLLTMIATIIGIFAWGKGFAGLIKYYLRLSKEAEEKGDKELAKKYQDRATKMAKTVLTNFLAGKYKK